MPSNAVPTSPRPPSARSAGYDPYLLGGGSVVPYVSAWSGEEVLPGRVVQHPGGGIAYADETSVDRDEHGVLWSRMASRIGSGRPLFAKLHPLRQRRAMRRLLCQVCARPADRTEDGLLWLVSREGIRDLADLEGMITPQPPLCRQCAPVSATSCPWLRRGCLAVRAHTRLRGVNGLRYQPGTPHLTLAPDDDRVFGYHNPVVRWVQAVLLARSLHNCIPLDLHDVV